MGFALGTKLTVLAFWGMLLIGVLGWNLATTRRWAKETIPHAALWGAVSLIVGLPWYIKTWLYTGNPVYPFFYNLFGGRYWNAENAALYSGDQARFGIDKTPVSLLLGPWQVTMEPLTRNWVNSLIPPGSPEPERPFIFTEFISFSLSPILLALFIAAPLLLGKRRLSQVSIYLVLFSIGVYVFWFFLMQQTRYLIPAIPAIAVVGAEALMSAWEERRRFVGMVGGVLIAMSLAWAVYLIGTQLTAPALPVVLGQKTVSVGGSERLCSGSTRTRPRTPKSRCSTNPVPTISTDRISGRSRTMPPTFCRGIPTRTPTTGSPTSSAGATRRFLSTRSMPVN
jgi:4-amino-4-deoxy-L-arabinose transferase-like glycosyltransferase